MKDALETLLRDPVARFFVYGAAALLLGLLIGTEREHSRQKDDVGFWAGMRTFPLFSLLGYVAVVVSAHLSGAVFLVTLGAFGILVATAHVVTSRLGGGVGLTTEAAAFVTFLLGGLVGAGRVVEAAGGAVAVAALLHLKSPMHAFAKSLEERDVAAALKFATLAVLVVPLLPDQSFGPYGFLNPFRFGLVVAVVCGIGFGGYVLTKALGGDRGIALTGFLGGLVSSTAVTLAMARQSRKRAVPERLLAVAVVLASLASAIAVLAVAIPISPALFPVALLPLGSMAVTAALFWLWLRRRSDSGSVPAPALSNPFELLPALLFATVLFLVLLATRAARQELGSAGHQAVVFLSGLTQLDAVTISIALESREGLPLREGALGLGIAACANCIFKAGIGAVVGTAELRRILVPACGGMAAAAAAGGVAAWFLAP